jgi:uncharacterized protein (TIGR03067 family)
LTPDRTLAIFRPGLIGALYKLPKLPSFFKEEDMIRRLMAVVTVCFLSASLGMAGNKTAKDDLQGVWQAVVAECGGNPSTTEQVDELRIVIQGEKFDIRPDGDNRKTTFKVDNNKSPKTIDLTVADGPDKGKVALGIYSFEGGQLKMCINLFGKDRTLRPTEFRTQSGDGFGLATFRRVSEK